MTTFTEIQKTVVQEVISLWFEKNVLLDSNGGTLFCECYRSYNQFCDNNGYLVQSKKAFSTNLKSIILDKRLQSKISFKNRNGLTIRGIILI